MLPDRCSVSRGGKRCPSPPEFVVSVADGPDEYMIGVACGAHRRAIGGRAEELQKQGRMPPGRVRFERLRAVGTDCVRGDPDDLVAIG